MKHDRYLAAALVSFLAAASPARACRTDAELRVEDVTFAKVVVVGQIANYEIVRDQAAREKRRQMLAANPDMPAEMRELLERPTTGVLGDYARFDILVDEVLAGEAPRTLSVTWNNSTFGEPETMAGRHLVALREPGSRAPPLRGPSATILANPETQALTVLQAACAPAFIFPESSKEAADVRQALKSHAK